MGLRLASAVLAVLGLGAPALGKEAVCPGGSYTIPCRHRACPLSIVALPDIVIEDGRVSLFLGLCPPVPATITPAPRGRTRVRAAWPSCDTVGPVRLRARIDRTCWRMRGVVVAPAAHTRRGFSAARLPWCGNAVRERDEECDDGNTTDGDCCSATCRLELPCAATCSADADCASDRYCAKAAGDCNGAGACVKRAEVCLAVVDPVCGCDGNTYGNACEAARAGVNVAERGVCDRTCGTIVGIPCPEGQFCEFPAGMCGGADLAGSCVPVPTACPRNLDPVCGCNGTTYPNDCARRAREIQKDHDGRCRSPSPY